MVPSGSPAHGGSPSSPGGRPASTRPLARLLSPSERPFCLTTQISFDLIRPATAPAATASENACRSSNVAAPENAGSIACSRDRDGAGPPLGRGPGSPLNDAA